MTEVHPPHDGSPPHAHSFLWFSSAFLQLMLFEKHALSSDRMFPLGHMMHTRYISYLVARLSVV
jgi:hypothetical protein